MNEPFEQIDLHGLRQDEAIRVIDTALRNAGPRISTTYKLICILFFAVSLPSEILYCTYQFRISFRCIAVIRP